MHKLNVPGGVDWELLVVNNNCTDDTDGVIERHAAALPVRPLHEPEPGQSSAGTARSGRRGGTYPLDRR